MPKRDVDSVLPLAIAPQPQQIARVFVGRVEVLSPATKHSILEAVDRQDSASLQKFGRFLDVYAKLLNSRARAILNALASLAQAERLASCIR